MTNQPALPTLDEIRLAQRRIAADVLPIPLARFESAGSPAVVQLQLENLQPVGSYKLRGAGNAILSADAAALANGVVTVSAGNLGQGIGWYARRMGIPCRVLVPEHAPDTKVLALRRYGAQVRRIPLDEWWHIMSTGELAGDDGLFIHGVFNRELMAGHGTIALEILAALPDVDSVVIPFGGGALTCGIAAAFKALKPEVAIYACEIDTAAPLRAALDHGKPVDIDYRPSFVDGIGSRSVFPQMWPLLQSVVTDSITVTLDQVREAIRMLAMQHRVVAEGAGAAALAAALTGRAGAGNVAAIISGGHIDPRVFADILRPEAAAAGPLDRDPPR